jgi:deazaflavin-dependent oxidoreductase (nitroreductase family)
MASFSGRMANLMSRYLPAFGRWGTRRQVEQYRSSGGTKGDEIFGKPVFLLELVGRSSGEPRPVMLMLVRRGDDLVVVGSNGGNPKTPNWYLNLMAAGGGTVQVGADRWDVTARELEGGERDECWALATAAYPDFASYQELTERRIPVAVLERATG